MIPDFLQRDVQKNHDLRQIHVLDSVWRSKTGSTEKFTLKSIMTNSGIQLVNMTSTMLQDKRKAKLSFPNKLIQLMNLTMILEKTPYLINMRVILPHIEFSNLISTLLNLKNLPRFLSLPNFGESFLRLQKKLIIEYNKNVKVVIPKPYFNGGKPKPKPTLGKPNPKTLKSIFIRMTIVLKTLMLQLTFVPKKMCWAAMARMGGELTNQTGWVI